MTLPLLNIVVGNGNGDGVVAIVAAVGKSFAVGAVIDGGDDDVVAVVVVGGMVVVVVVAAVEGDGVVALDATVGGCWHSRC